VSAADTLMWEAKAAPGKRDALFDWARRALPPLTGPDVAGDGRQVELFADAGERIVVILPLAGDHRIPDPPAGLIARPPHQWRFTFRGTAGR